MRPSLPPMTSGGRSIEKVHGLIYHPQVLLVSSRPILTGTAFGQEKMSQSLSILTGASAGATESFVCVFVLSTVLSASYLQSELYEG